MTYSTHLTKIEQWVGNIHVFEIIQNEQIIETTIKDIINPNGAINIEILQFVDRFPFYHRLEDKRKALVKKISQINDYGERLKLGEEVNQVVTEQRAFIKDTIFTAHMFTKMQLKQHLEKVVKLFFAGNITDADRELDEVSIRQDQNQLLKYLEEQEKLKQACDQLEDNANEFKVKAEITMINLDIETPENRFQESIHFFDLGLISAKYTERKIFISEYSTNYGNFLLKHKQHNKAQPLYDEALQILRQLVQQNPQTFMPKLAQTLNNLAILYSDKNDFSKAQPLYDEALQILRQLVENEPHTFLPKMAMMLNNLAILYKDRNEFNKAQPLYDEALRIYRQLTQHNSETYLPDMTSTLNNLANLYSTENDFSKAQPLFEEALQIRRQLAQHKPQTYLPDVAQTLSNLAILYGQRGEFSQAQPLFEEALQIRKELAQHSPQTYLPDMALTLNNVAILYYKKREFSQSQSLYDEALQIYRKLAQLNPQTYLPDVAMTLNNLANLYSAKNEFSQAQTLFEEALQVRRQLAQHNPRTFLPNVAETLISMGKFYQETMPNRELSSQLLKEAIAILQPFSNIGFIQNYLKIASKSLTNWGKDLEKDPVDK